MDPIQEKSYEVFPTTVGSLVFAIAQKKGEVDHPRVVYDGGPHALLFRSSEEVVILDFLHPKAQKLLKNLDETYISEIDHSVSAISKMYAVPVQHVKRLPLDLSALEQKRIVPVLKVKPV